MVTTPVLLHARRTQAHVDADFDKHLDLVGVGAMKFTRISVYRRHFFFTLLDQGLISICVGGNDAPEMLRRPIDRFDRTENAIWIRILRFVSNQCYSTQAINPVRV